MKALSTLEILQEWRGTSDLNALVSTLNTSGIITDEDSTGLSSTMIEAWTADCEAFVRSCGYTGGTIGTVGNFFDEHGAIYALYDSGRIDHKAAHTHLRDVNARPVD